MDGALPFVQETWGWLHLQDKQMYSEELTRLVQLSLLKFLQIGMMEGLWLVALWLVPGCHKKVNMDSFLDTEWYTYKKGKAIILFFTYLQ